MTKNHMKYEFFVGSYPNNNNNYYNNNYYYYYFLFIYCGREIFGKND